MTGKIGLKKTVDGIVIFGPGRNFRQTRFQIGGWGTGKRDVRIPICALINPGAEQADLVGRQAGAFFGHDAVGLEALDQSDEETFGTFSGHNDRAGITAFEKSFAGIDSKAAFVLAVAVTLDATGFEDG